MYSRIKTSSTIQDDDNDDDKLKLLENGKKNVIFKMMMMMIYQNFRIRKQNPIKYKEIKQTFQDPDYDSPTTVVMVRFYREYPIINI